MQTLTVGHTDTLTILYLDQNGNPMKVPPIPDGSPPIVWENDAGTPPADQITISPDGTQAVVQALAVGTDSISVTVFVDGTSYSASDVIQISDAPQTLTSITIEHTVSL